MELTRPLYIGMGLYIESYFFASQLSFWSATIRQVVPVTQYIMLSANINVPTIIVLSRLQSFRSVCIK